MTTWECTALGWSVQDIINKNLYLGKVAALPTKFPCLSSCYKAFQMPLLEESRAHLQQGLEELSTADYMIVSYKGRARHGKHDDIERELIKVNVGIVQLFRRGKVEDSWKPKPTDVILLCTFLPVNVDDLLEKHEEHYTLALISNSEDDFAASFQVKTRTSIMSPLLASKTWYAIYINNAATVRRIWDALIPDRTVFQDNRKHTVVKQNLYGHGQLIKECTTSGIEEPCDRKANHLRLLVEQYCMSRRLNEPQTVAVSSTVMGLIKSDGVRTKLIQGPPGTGKTTVVTVLLSIITSFTNNVLVTAPTNRAVAEIAERFLTILPMEQSLLLSEMADCLSPLGHLVRNLAPLHIGDVLLVGNESKIDLDGPLGDIYLINRVKLLTKAMAPISGWQASAEEVLDILSTDSGLVQYKQYEQLCAVEKRPCPAFVEFIQQKMNNLGKNWIESGLVMCKHLPSKVLSARARELLQLSSNLMVNLLKCLTNTQVKDKQVRLWFKNICKRHDTSDSTTHTDFYESKEKLLAIMDSRPGFDVLKSVAKITKNTPGFDGLRSGVEAICRKAKLLFCTTSTAGTQKVKGSGPFDYAVIDEAGQLIEAETAIITQLAGVNQILLVGDPNQLQAMVTSKISAKSGYGRSLFDRLQGLGHPYQILRIQYRMHPEISKFPNEQFYGGMLQDAPGVQHESSKIPCKDYFGSYAFINASNGQEKRGASGKSFENEIECDAVHFIVKKIQSENTKTLSVGIISPYKAQIERMSKRISVLASRNSKRSSRLNVDLKTVDGFQGAEKDIIIFSAVRSNSSGMIGFLDDFRRLNVAITRARHCLWIIGHEPTLSSIDPLWRAVIADAKNRFCYRNAEVVPRVGTIIPLPLERLSYVNEEENIIQKKMHTWSLKEVNNVQRMMADTRLPGQDSGIQVVVEKELQTLSLKEVRTVQYMKKNTRFPGQASGEQGVVEEKPQASAVKEARTVQHMKVNTKWLGQASGEHVVVPENQQSNVIPGKPGPDRQLQEENLMRSQKQLPLDVTSRQLVAEDLSKAKETSKSHSKAKSGASFTDRVHLWALGGILCLPLLLVVKAVCGRSRT